MSRYFDARLYMAAAAVVTMEQEEQAMRNLVMFLVTIL